MPLHSLDCNAQAAFFQPQQGPGEPHWHCPNAPCVHQKKDQGSRRSITGGASVSLNGEHVHYDPAQAQSWPRCCGLHVHARCRWAQQEAASKLLVGPLQQELSQEQPSQEEYLRWQAYQLDIYAPEMAPYFSNKKNYSPGTWRCRSRTSQTILLQPLDHSSQSPCIWVCWRHDVWHRRSLWRNSTLHLQTGHIRRWRWSSFGAQHVTAWASGF